MVTAGYWKTTGLKSQDIRRRRRNSRPARSTEFSKVMSIDVKKTPIKITCGGTLLAGSGVGASAASCVSLPGPWIQNSIWVIQLKKSTGWPGRANSLITGSPVELIILASTYGGLLHFQVKNKQQHFEKIHTPKPFEIVLANSGITANTALLDVFIRPAKGRQSGAFCLSPQKLSRPNPMK